ncbi:MAG: AAA family ATPase [Planctomycetes bacterium]|nr:AAA family ATPase [Planctomycetota bacterium]
MDPALLTPNEVANARAALQRLRDGMAAVLLGQDELVSLVTIALASRGHVLLEGLPGLGKTELVKSLSKLLGLGFGRIQFTPDLLPSDVTGGAVLEESGGRKHFVFQRGPLFANCVLADEINRASPKTQSALLEAMQERRVTVLGESHPLPAPFFVLATQNPIELEGTYPLPEAQRDRFLFKLDVPPVGAEVLTRIVRERRRGQAPESHAVFAAGELDALFSAVDRVALTDGVAGYIARLVAASDPRSEACPEALRPFLRFGASPRAAIGLAEAGRASALLEGRPNVDFDDVQRVAPSVLAHRLVLEHAARLEGITAREIVSRLLAATDPLGQPLPAGVRG